MEPTLEEALKKGIEAHKAGQVQEADRLSEPSTKSQDPPSAQLQSIINLYTQGQLQQALSDATEMLEKIPEFSCPLQYCWGF